LLAFLKENGYAELCYDLASPRGNGIIEAKFTVVTEDGEQAYLDLEVELNPQTPEETLTAIVAVCRMNAI